MGTLLKVLLLMLLKRGGFGLNYDWLIVACFICSAITAIAGLGGGILLLSIMQLVVPVEVLIPLHASIQWVSNASRAALTYGSIDWKLTRRFAIGSVVGAALGAPLTGAFATDYIPLLLGAFILVSTWIPLGRRSRQGPSSYAVVGGVSTFCSIFVGVSGPLAVAALLRDGLGRERLVSTAAMMMSLLHTLKIAAWSYAGFSIVDHLGELSWMMLATGVGSLVGTMLRQHFSEANFQWALKVLLTALACNMLYGASS